MGCSMCRSMCGRWKVLLPVVGAGDRKELKTLIQAIHKPSMQVANRIPRARKIAQVVSPAEAAAKTAQARAIRTRVVRNLKAAHRIKVKANPVAPTLSSKPARHRRVLNQASHSLVNRSLVIHNQATHLPRVLTRKVRAPLKIPLNPAVITHNHHPRTRRDNHRASPRQIKMEAPKIVSLQRTLQVAAKNLIAIRIIPRKRIPTIEITLIGKRTKNEIARRPTIRSRTRMKLDRVKRNRSLSRIPNLNLHNLSHHRLSLLSLNRRRHQTQIGSILIWDLG